MSASLRSAAPAGAPRPVPDFGRSTPPLQRSAAHDRRAGLPLDGISRHAEQEAPAEGPQEPSSRPGTPESGLAVRDRCYRADSGGPGEHSGRTVPALEAEQSSGDLLSRRRPRPGFRLGRRRGVAGLVVVCVLALGVAACSVRDARAEASASASASASAAVARAEKGIADANASATASREAALTPELRAKRDAALAEPAPAKPPQLNEESAEGAAASVGYFLNLYRYAFMTGKTNEVDSMSENGCVFCKSVIDRANQLHKDGGWADKWNQDITNIRYYDKLEGYDYSRIEATINYGEMTSYSGGSWKESVAPPTEGQKVRFAIRYVNGGWAIREGEVL